jgi:integrase
LQRKKERDNARRFEGDAHVLRHTCTTWLMQKGVDLWAAAGFPGMTVRQLEQSYGHHHPDYQQQAVAALGCQHAQTGSIRGARS